MGCRDRTDGTALGCTALALGALVALATLAGGAAAHASSEDHGTLTFHDTEEAKAQTSAGHLGEPVVLTCEFWVRGSNVSHASGTILGHHDLGSSHAHTHETRSWNGTENASGGWDFEAGPFTLHEEDMWELQASTGEGREHTTRPHRAEYHACQDPAPACPEGLRAEARADGDIALAWNDSPEADTYQVYRSSGDGLAPLATLTETSYLDNRTEAHATYQYQVTAVHPVGESEGCPVVAATAIPFFPSPAIAALAGLAGAGVLVLARSRGF